MNSRLFIRHFVGAGEQGGRHLETEGLRSLQATSGRERLRREGHSLIFKTGVMMT
jgi:hypothetical protein